MYSRCPHGTLDGVPLTPEHPFIDTVRRALERCYGDRLVAAALFGSVARRTARPDSDVDLFIVAAGLPRGRRARLATFDAVDREVASPRRMLAAEGLLTEVLPVLRTPEEIRTATPLMLDLTEDAFVLVERDGSLARALDDLRARLRRVGARRVFDAEGWYWDLKPDYRRGEIVEI